jgi:hypothetical protein
MCFLPCQHFSKVRVKNHPYCYKNSTRLSVAQNTNDHGLEVWRTIWSYSSVQYRKYLGASYGNCGLGRFAMIGCTSCSKLSSIHVVMGTEIVWFCCHHTCLSFFNFFFFEMWHCQEALFSVAASGVSSRLSLLSLNCSVSILILLKFHFNVRYLVFLNNFHITFILCTAYPFVTLQTIPSSIVNTFIV